MIQYTLICENKHTFDAWFKSSQAYAAQRESGILECPMCATTHISKALMAPAVSTKPAQAETIPVQTSPGPENTAASAGSPSRVSLSTGHPEQAKIRAALKKMRDTVVSEAEYVGDRFADEARKIHTHESENRGIYGEATADEVKALIDDGVDFVPLPTLPEDLN